MHKSKQTDRREREKRNTEEANQIKTWNSHPGRKSAGCQSSSFAFCHQDSREYPTRYLHLMYDIKLPGKHYLAILTTSRFLISGDKNSPFALPMAASKAMQFRELLPQMYLHATSARVLGKKTKPKHTNQNQLCRECCLAFHITVHFPLTPDFAWFSDDVFYKVTFYLS